MTEVRGFWVSFHSHHPMMEPYGSSARLAGRPTRTVQNMTVESALSLSFRWLRLLLPDPRPAPDDTKQEKREVLLPWGYWPYGLTEPC